MQPRHQASLQVSTDLDALAQVLEWFDQFNNPPVPHQAWMQCQLALAEGFTNAVRHAHQGRSSDLMIDVEVQVFEDRMEIRIWDQGDQFDLNHRLKSMPDLDSEEDGGRGLRLMERIADFLSYTRTSEGTQNCLLIVKKFLPLG
ncbi:MAG: ATP-binding protein [Leptolyngbyaceae cyanobacterium RU_5_1]|nr:ATP-binding protein [Leptolyngbyaceae cyanobacterium RU_5_1]